MPQSQPHTQHAYRPTPQPVRPLRVLVVEDSRPQRRVLAGMLRRWGYDVTEADSGETALALCGRDLPDLILSDWMMPGLSGPEFCRALRDMDQRQYTYFILLTCKTDRNAVAQGLNAGADDFLNKPVNRHELRARLTAGERIVAMERELGRRNRMIAQTLSELQALYDSLDMDLLEAKKLQQSLLPERHRRYPEGTLSLLLRSSGHVGGDLVGFFEAGPGQLGLFGIDVSGHGVTSALMTARLAGYLSSTAPDQNVALARQPDGSHRVRPLSQVVTVLNDTVLNDMETEHYFTLLLACVDLKTGRVRISQAGHPHPLVQRADGRIERVGAGGFPVGLLFEAEFEEFEIVLEPGDRLFVLSDGIGECPDAAGDMLSEDGLNEMITGLHRMAAPAVLSGLVWRLSEHAGSSAFPDDISAILFEYTGPKKTGLPQPSVGAQGSGAASSGRRHSPAPSKPHPG